MKALATKPKILGALLFISVCVNAFLILSPRDSGPKLLPKLTTANVTALGWAGDKSAPKGLGENHLPSGDFLIAISNQYPDGQQDNVHEFQAKATSAFTLKSSGHPDVTAKLTGAVVNAEHMNLESFEAKVEDADRAKIVHGATYTIEPVGDQEKPVHWSIPDGLTLKVP